MEKLANSDAENIEANYDVASAHTFYAEFLEKNNRWKESFSHRQKAVDALRPLEEKGDIPEFYTADFFRAYAGMARAAAKTGHKELAENSCQKAESVKFEIDKCAVGVQNEHADVYAYLGDAYTILGDRQKAVGNYSKTVQTWKNLLNLGKLYPLDAKKLTEIEQKLNQ